METQPVFHPWHDVRRLQREMDQLLNDLAPAWRWPLTGDYPPLNIIRTDSGVALEALCPGMDRDTFDITVVGDAVTLRCERQPPADVSAARCHRRERPSGTFTRTIATGERFDPDQTRATYRNGVLRVELGHTAATAPKKIAIQS